MSIFIDSANLHDIEWAMQQGWVQGVTTNPLLLARESRDPKTLLQEIAARSRGPIFYQLIQTDMKQMLQEAARAKDLLQDRLILKIAPTETGFQFIHEHPEHEFCPTAIFAPSQALVAAESGATYIAIYVNRATRLSEDGLSLIQGCADLLEGRPIRILAASLKDPNEAVFSLLSGAHDLTMDRSTLVQLVENPHSQQAIEDFQSRGAGLSI